jgi:hypothetical protein
MRRQSSRAEITPWSFDNEYEYGDFGGDAVQMMRRGFDLHLHYANFGIRKLLIRLPDGFPDATASAPYLEEEDSLKFLPDKQGPGGILSIRPFHEAGDLDELWEIDSLVDRLVPLRAEIQAGDLRPLYLAHLATACDGNHDPDETKEGPVPAGLAKLTDAQHALAEFHGLSDAFITAAAQGSPPLEAQNDPHCDCAAWLQSQPAATKDAWLLAWIREPQSNVRREILAEFRKSRPARAWPTVDRGRTIAELIASAATIAAESERKTAEHAARQRARRLARMAADPSRTLRETEKLVRERSMNSYEQIATLLADLREALAGSEQSGLAEQQARKLRAENPTLHRLTRELRGKGFVPK